MSDRHGASGPPDAPRVVQRRGACVETVHPWSLRAVAGGRVVAALGDDRVTPWRSAAKPFQLATSLAWLGDPEVPEDELAVGAASHSGEPVHIAIVQRILARFGQRAVDLRCGAHPPVHVPSAEAVLRAGGAFDDLCNNCSGKHSFMLAAAARAGAPLDYRPAEHPLQRAICERVTALGGVAPELAVDGCGVPTFCLPLSAIARAWSVLAEAMAAGEGASDDWPRRLSRIGWAMARRPELTSGTDRFDLHVARAAREPMAVKIGAMGVFCIALPERGLGLAFKVHSGSTEALAAAVPHGLAVAAPGAFDEPEGFAPRGVRNVVGREVGRWELEAP